MNNQYSAQMNASLQILAMLLVASMLGYMLHWVVCRAQHGAIVDEGDDVAGPLSSGRDDLTKIEGIGSKIQSLLYKAEIYTYDDLAETSRAQLTKILHQAGDRYAMHDPKSWSRQARMAAEGNWKGLAKLQDELVGGRDKKG